MAAAGRPDGRSPGHGLECRLLIVDGACVCDVNFRSTSGSEQQRRTDGRRQWRSVECRERRRPIDKTCDQLWPGRAITITGSCQPPSPLSQLALRLTLHCKNIRISADTLWRLYHILTEPVPCTFVSVYPAVWTCASLFRRFTDTNVYTGQESVLRKGARVETLHLKKQIGTGEKFFSQGVVSHWNYSYRKEWSWRSQ